MMVRVSMSLTVVLSALAITFGALLHLLAQKSVGCSNRNPNTNLVILKSEQPSYPWQTVEYNASASIPFHLWQTYATDQIPRQAAEAVQTWRSQNADMPITFHDDEMADTFILESFGSEISCLFLLGRCDLTFGDVL